MRGRIGRLSLLTLAMWVWAGSASANTPWAPQNELYAINYRWSGILLLMVAVGVGVGLLGVALFRPKRVRVDHKAGLVERHPLGYRLAHWTNGIGFLLAAFTGAAILGWIKVPMSLANSLLLHNVGAAAILLGFLAVAAYATTRGTTSKHRIIPTWKNVHEAIGELFGYAGLVGDRGVLGFKSVQLPVGLRRSIEKFIGFKAQGRSDKYLAAQKVLSYPLWALLGLSIVATGLLKSIQYSYALPVGVIKWSTIIHDATAIGILVMLVAHVSAVVLVKTNWPMLKSMITGTVPISYARTSHANWYNELTTETPDKRTAAEIAATREAGLVGRGD